jgi:hypothetical protein
MDQNQERRSIKRDVEETAERVRAWREKYPHLITQSSSARGARIRAQHEQEQIDGEDVPQITQAEKNAYTSGI